MVLADGFELDEDALNGEKILGQGSFKDAWTFGPNHVLVVTQCEFGDNDPLDEEFENERQTLRRLERAGFPVAKILASGTITRDKSVHAANLMHRYPTGNRSHRVDFGSYVNEATVDSLVKVQDLINYYQWATCDMQFLISETGAAVINDPGEVSSHAHDMADALAVVYTMLAVARYVIWMRGRGQGDRVAQHTYPMLKHRACRFIRDEDSRSQRQLIDRYPVLADHDKLLDAYA